MKEWILASTILCFSIYYVWHIELNALYIVSSFDFFKITNTLLGKYSYLYFTDEEMEA